MLISLQPTFPQASWGGVILRPLAFKMRVVQFVLDRGNLPGRLKRLMRTSLSIIRTDAEGRVVLNRSEV